MNSLYDVQQLLKKFGTVIYIGDRLADLEMMEDEIRELYKAKCLSTQDFQAAVLLVRQEAERQRNRQGEKA